MGTESDNLIGAGLGSGGFAALESLGQGWWDGAYGWTGFPSEGGDDRRLGALADFDAIFGAGGVGLEAALGALMLPGAEATGMGEGMRDLARQLLKWRAEMGKNDRGAWSMVAGVLGGLSTRPDRLDLFESRASGGATARCRGTFVATRYDGCPESVAPLLAGADGGASALHAGAGRLSGLVGILNAVGLDDEAGSLERAIPGAIAGLVEGVFGGRIGPGLGSLGLTPAATGSEAMASSGRSTASDALYVGRDESAAMTPAERFARAKARRKARELAALAAGVDAMATAWSARRRVEDTVGVIAKLEERLAECDTLLCTARVWVDAEGERAKAAAGRARLALAALAREQAHSVNERHEMRRPERERDASG